jgi:trehalose synthase
VSEGTEREDYVDWLEQESMLAGAGEIAAQFSGTGDVWQNPYANPNAKAAVAKASVWFTAYPISMITKPGHSFLSTLADEDLWRVFEAIGINAVHTGPVKRAGGIDGRDLTPSIDGHFDRISTEIDEAFGTDLEFRRLCEVAAAHGGIVIDDIVPGHTGKGADFRLAEMKVGDYPGIYHMVEIPPADWHLLPDVPAGKDSVNLDREAEERLQQAGHIIGQLQRVIFHDPGIKDTIGALRRRSPAQMASSGDGCTCITSRTVSLPSTGWTRRSLACAWSSVMRCIRWVNSELVRCGWTRAAFLVWRRAPRVTPAPGGRRDIHCPGRSTS